MFPLVCFLKQFILPRNSATLRRVAFASLLRTHNPNISSTIAEPGPRAAMRANPSKGGDAKPRG